MTLLHPTKAELGTVACSSLPLKLQLTHLTWYHPTPVLAETITIVSH